ncbi:MAG: hypothetical protein ACRDLM_12275 [Gaiellaceae bacterium]
MAAVTVPDLRVHVDAVLAALRAGLPSSYTVTEAVGPSDPAVTVPYVVLYADLGTPGGYPFCPGRDLDVTISLRGVGESADQAQKAASRARTIMLSGGIAVTGRALKIYQDTAAPPPVERDATITPPLFQQLVIFDLCSRPA